MIPGSSPVSLEELLAQAGWLRRLAGTLVSGEAADDLVQETWLAALRHPPRDAGPVRPWLARVARNLAANLRRGAERRAAHEGVARPADVELDPERIAGEVEAQRLLAEAVQRLAEPLRTTVVLRYLRGLDSPEIARLTRVPAGTVRWRLRRGVELLREDLDQRLGGRETWLGALAALWPRPASVSPGAASGWAAGASVMTASLKIGVAVGVALAALTAVWILVDGREELPEPESASAHPPIDVRVSDSAPRGDALASALEPEAVREALAAEPLAPPEPVIADCCIVGRVLDGEGRGVPGARVDARAAVLDAHTLLSRLRADDPPLTTGSGPGGVFSLEVPGRRPFVLRAEHPDFAPAASALVFAGERRDVVLQAGSVLTVHVSASTSSVPCRGALVRVRLDARDAGADLWAGEGRADERGNASFRGLPAGDAQVEARFEQLRGVRAVATDGRASAHCALELLATGRIDGTVVDRVTRQPIAGARVGSSYYEVEEVTTDALGRFALEGIGLGEGFWSLGAHARGYASLYQMVRLPPGREQRTLEFALQPASSAQGRVLDPERRPIPGARLVLLATLRTEPMIAETDRKETVADASGRFTVEGLHPAVPYRVLVSGTGYATGIFACGPISAGSEPVDLGELVLVAGASISGEARPAPSSGESYLVELHWSGEDSVTTGSDLLSHLETTRTDPRGRFAFAELAGGRYRLALLDPSDDGRGRGSRSVAETLVELAPGEERDDIVLQPGVGTIAGTVVGPTGPAGACTLRLFALSAPDEELALAYTDDEGGFRLHAPDTGPFRIVVDDRQLFLESRSVEAVGLGEEGLRIELLEFRSPNVIRGRLVAEDGELSPGLYVRFTDAATGDVLWRVAIPEPDGRFEMKNLRGVPYDLELLDFEGEYDPLHLPGVRPDGAETELRLRRRDR